jgi:methylmalonyl-CoA/ethylmalonyl-CoA epimerase
VEEKKMNAVRELQAELRLPQVAQIGVVVRNVDATAEFLSTMLGLGPFIFQEFQPEKHWFREEPCPLRLLMAKAIWGNLELELVQPLEGRGLHKEFLETHGEGLEHLGFEVSDYEEMFDRFTKAGFCPVERAETYVDAYKGYVRACYFDTYRVGGILCEIIWKSWLADK